MELRPGQFRGSELIQDTALPSALMGSERNSDMGMLVNIIVIALVGGYAAHLIIKIVSSMKAGKGNPYGCTGDCSRCGSGCCGSGPKKERRRRPGKTQKI